MTGKLSNLNWAIFMSVNVIKGEAEGMCGCTGERGWAEAEKKTTEVFKLSPWTRE